MRISFRLALSLLCVVMARAPVQIRNGELGTYTVYSRFHRL